MGGIFSTAKSNELLISEKFIEEYCEPLKHSILEMITTKTTEENLEQFTENLRNFFNITGCSEWNEDQLIDWNESQEIFAANCFKICISNNLFYAALMIREISLDGGINLYPHLNSIAGGKTRLLRFLRGEADQGVIELTQDDLSLGNPLINEALHRSISRYFEFDVTDRNEDLADFLRRQADELEGENLTLNISPRKRLFDLYQSEELALNIYRDLCRELSQSVVLDGDESDSESYTESDADSESIEDDESDQEPEIAGGGVGVAPAGDIPPEPVAQEVAAIQTLQNARTYTA